MRNFGTNTLIKLAMASNTELSVNMADFRSATLAISGYCSDTVEYKVG